MSISDLSAPGRRHLISGRTIWVRDFIVGFRVARFIVYFDGWCDVSELLTLLKSPRRKSPIFKPFFTCSLLNLFLPLLFTLPTGKVLLLLGKKAVLQGNEKHLRFNIPGARNRFFFYFSLLNIGLCLSVICGSHMVKTLLSRNQCR